MDRHIFFLTFVLLMSCEQKPKEQTEVSEQAGVPEQEVVQKTAEVEVMDFQQLQPLLSAKEGKTTIVNFWATWCKPCLKELPYFEEINDSLGSSGVEVILVSLDFPKKLDTQLRPFVEEHQLGSRVILLDDPRENVWIPKVDSTWTGALPATLIINKGARKFYEKSFDRATLQSELTTFLNPES